MNTPLEDQLRAGLTKRPVLVNLQRPTTTVADLFSNDYLSLSADPSLRANVLDRLSHEQNILGSCGSRLLDGNTKTHVSMETRLRDYYDSPAALIFNSGYDANLALFGALPQRGDAIVYDELLHASAVDGMRASRAAKSLYPFKHNSVTSLKAVLQDVITSHRVGLGSSTVFVAFETVYSMDGDVAPVLDLVEAVEQTVPEGCAKIAIDEAHSTGLYGPGGRGLISHLGLDKRVALRLHTFSKAMAGVGGEHRPFGRLKASADRTLLPAVVLCSELIRMYLINFARPFIYTTSLSPVSLIATELSFDIVEGAIGDQVGSFASTSWEKFPELFFCISSENDYLRCTHMP